MKCYCMLVSKTHFYPTELEVKLSCNNVYVVVLAAYT